MHAWRDPVRKQWHGLGIAPRRKASTTAGIVFNLNLPQLSIVTTHDYLKADPECTKRSSVSSYGMRVFVAVPKWSQILVREGA